MAELIGTKMISDGKTARQLFEEVMANPARRKFGSGRSSRSSMSTCSRPIPAPTCSRPPTRPTRARSSTSTRSAGSRANGDAGDLEPGRLQDDAGDAAYGAPVPTPRIACRTSSTGRRATPSTRAARSTTTIFNTPSACRAPSSKPRSARLGSHRPPGGDGGGDPAGPPVGDVKRSDRGVGIALSQEIGCDRPESYRSADKQRKGYHFVQSHRPAIEPCRGVERLRETGGYRDGRGGHAERQEGARPNRGWTMTIARMRGGRVGWAGGQVR